MVVAAIRDFLESSTIHGLVHISTAKSLITRTTWVAIVVACFGSAIWIIRDSYKDWQESPVSTTITTHPITDLEFPAVTVCPPRKSNTAVNHLLTKINDANFTDLERQDLRNSLKQVFLQMPSEKYASQVTELLSAENFSSILNGHSEMPEEVDNQRLIVVRSSEFEGSFRTPGLSDPDYKGDFFSKPITLQYVLDLPNNIGEMVGENGALVISVQSESNWSYKFQEKRLQFYKTKLNHSEAEEFCVRRGGHLVSVLSQEEQDEIQRMAYDFDTWLGGKKGVDGEWYWLDGKKWEYQQLLALLGGDCLVSAGGLTLWTDGPCHVPYFFICENKENFMMENHEFVLEKQFLFDPFFHFWWNSSSPNNGSTMEGFQISWTIENGSLPDRREFVSKSLSGNVSTPGFGSKASLEYNKERHEYVVIIELPYNITDLIGADVFEVDIISDENGVELLTESLRYDYINVKLNWTAAEGYCLSRGGHLASVSTTHDWLALQKFIAEGNFSQNIWIGGTDQKKEGEWAWSDGSKWSEEHWGPYDPKNNDGDEDFLMISGNEYWIASYGSNPFICQVPMIWIINERTHLKFTAENITTLQFNWVQQPGSTNSSIVNGFSLIWQIKQANHDRQLREDVWKMKPVDPIFKDKSMLAVMNLIREGKKHKVSENKMWDAILKHRWSPEILKNESPCLEEDQKYKVIIKAAQELDLTVGFNAWIPDTDLEFGAKLFSAIHYCPKHLAEAARMSIFFDFLLTNHSLETLVLATMNSIQPNAGDNVKDFTAIDMWYEVLDKKYNFAFGQIVTALSSLEQLTQLKKLDSPVLKNVHGQEEYNEILHFSGERIADLSHPPHLTSSEQLSAFIPFCAFSTSMIITRTELRLPNVSFPLCSSFKPTILEGQLCYKLQVNRTSGKGKGKELMLLLDYHEDLSMHYSSVQQQDLNSEEISTFNLNAIKSLQDREAQIQIDTLSSEKGYGEGTYKMSVVKRMTVTNAFLRMPMKDRKCQLELYEECRTKALLKECNCVPLEMINVEVNLSFFSFSVHSNQAGDICTSEGRNCIEKNAKQSFGCSTNCEGIYTDVQKSLEDSAVATNQNEDSKHEGNASSDNLQQVWGHVQKMLAGTRAEGDEENRNLISRLVNEYSVYKEVKLRNLRFNPYRTETMFGEEQPPSSLKLVQIYFDTATFDEIARDEKVKFTAALSLIGGTMGLLTGFSIISGVEIVYFLFKLISPYFISFLRQMFEKN